jgi:hypothetical protein
MRTKTVAVGAVLLALALTGCSTAAEPTRLDRAMDVCVQLLTELPGTGDGAPADRCNRALGIEGEEAFTTTYLDSDYVEKYRLAFG